jgi:DNA-directed RNA polymerase subunit RPC12/RpoP
MIKLITVLKELVTATEIICDKCGWRWYIKDGGDDLYICHDCWTDNTPEHIKEL